ncbi:hypothetical protein P9112_001012 [Eukaryota sp. TZLM1-RC]
MKLLLLCTFSILLFHSLASPTCSEDEYLHPISLKCETCPDGSLGDGSICSCYPGHATVSSDEGALSCVSCALNTTAVSLDRASCLPCEADYNKGECTCPSLTDYLTVSNLSTLICSPCPPNTVRPSPSSQHCLPCSSNGGGLSIIEDQCQCPSDYSFAFSSCLSQADLTSVLSRFPSHSQLSFHPSTSSNPITVDSFLVRQLFRPAYLQCKTLLENPSFVGNSSSLAPCNTLLNLCSLTYFSSESSLCESISELDDFPFVTYEDPASALRESSDWPVLGIGSNLDLRLGLWALDGEFKGYSDSSLLSFCGVTATSQSRKVKHQSWEVFGNDVDITCTFDLLDLISSSPLPFFAEMFLVYNDEFLPVPVRMVNNDDNYDLSSPFLTLSRRFFLFDHVFGSTSSSTTPTVIRFAKKVDLMFRTTPQSLGKVLLLPPILSIEYEEVITSSLENSEGIELTSGIFDRLDKGSLSPITSLVTDNRVSSRSFPITTFSSHTVSDSSTLLSLTNGLLWSITALCLVRWGVDLYVYNQRHVNNSFLSHSIFNGVNSICRIISNYFGVFLLLVSLFYLVVFRFQGIIVLLLPNEESFSFVYNVFLICLITSSIRIFLTCISSFYSDIFLVDWENSENPSCWRSVYIAKIWASLQSIRACDPFSLCFLTSLILGYFQLSRWSLSSLSVSDLAPESFILLLGTVSFVYLLSFIIIYLVKIPLNRWVYQSPLNRFLDLLPLTNISLLVLDEPFSGFYIHGRSVAGRSDVTSSELTSFLIGESRGTLPKRGVSLNKVGFGEDDHCQIFEVFLTGQDRSIFDRSWAAASRARSRALQQRSIIFNKNERDSRELNSFEQLGKVQSKANGQLIKWIDELITGNHIIKQSFVESWLRLSPSIHNQSNLVQSTESSIKNRSFLGKSLDFAIFEIFCISFFYSTLGLYPAILFTFSLSIVASFIRKATTVLSVAHHSLPLSQLVSA